MTARPPQARRASQRPTAALAVAALLAVLTILVGAASRVDTHASTTTRGVAETHVRAHDPLQPTVIEARQPIVPGQGRETPVVAAKTAIGSRVAPRAIGALDDVVRAQQVTVLGRYKGGTEAFIGKPGFNVLDLPSKGTGRWYWSRNRAFIDDAVARGDELRLVTNPFEPIYSGGNTFQRELRYLKDLGYRFEQSGDSWVAVPGR